MAKLFVITGGPASGKSTLLAKLKEVGIRIISADQIVKELYIEDKQLRDNLSTHFGASIISPNGEIDRNELRRKVFSDPTEKSWLENTVHPLVRQKFDAWLNQIDKSQLCAYEIPLFFEVKFNHPALVGVIVCYASESTLLERLKKRGLNTDQAMQLINSQIEIEQKALLADFIYNSEEGCDNFSALMSWVRKKTADN